MTRTRAEEAAHRYADHGWPVFPTKVWEKVPATEHGFLDATTNHKTIEGWWRGEPSHGVAIATGAPGPDVVDIDKHGDRSGFPAWNQLKQAGLTGEPQAAIRTPSGGAHMYYRGTEQRNGHLPEHLLDFRSTGGYVVAPPSAGKDGRPYEVVHKQASPATFDWAKARQHLDPQQQRQPQRAPERDSGRPRDVGHLAAWMAAQREGNRNEGLFWAANRAIEANDHATLGQLADAARSAGLDQREIDRTIRSAQQTSGSQRPFERERATVRATVPAERQPERPSPRSDVERATAAGTAAAQAHKQPQHEMEAGA